MEKAKLDKIKRTTEEFFSKMTVQVSEINVFNSENEIKEKEQTYEKPKEVINLEIKLQEPQILIGQGGQTLFEIQRILKNILIKQTQEIFYLNLDINDYKKNKTEHLKSFARSVADDVALSKKEKTLSPMSSYERRVVHSEISKRIDVFTESTGDGQNRSVIIKPK
jgi:spoIIIJ-associated protein